MFKTEISKLRDEELIDLAKLNHPRAISTLVDRYKGMVYTLSYRILRNQQDAEEAAQDCFVKAFKSIENFRFDSKFSTWLYRICYNNAISKLRKGKPQMADLDSLNNPQHDSQNVLDKMSADERKEYLTRAIDMLDPDESALISLYYTEENSITEISTITGLSESNVKVKLFRSRAKLYSNLELLLKKEIKTLLY